MKFSCLIPAYNPNPTHLFEALESVVNQTLPADEIIVVDDGSDNANSLKALALAVDVFGINLVRLEQNQGISVALNHGIELCRNEWIARMDADDICFKNRFEKQVALIEEFPFTDVVGCGISCFMDGDAKREKTSAIMHEPIFHKPELKADWLFCVNHPTAFYRKSVISKIKYREDHRRGQDVYLWADVLKQGHLIRNVQEILLKYRQYHDRKLLHKARLS